MSAEALTKYLSYFLLREDYLPHAYSVAELRSLRDILNLPYRTSDWARDWQRLTDEFAADIGFQCFFERRARRPARIKTLQNRIIKPAQTLASALEDQAILAEFGMDFVELQKLQPKLRKLGENALQQIEFMNSTSRKSRGSEDWLKHLHVHWTACFLETYNIAFWPTRMTQRQSAFEEAVEILGRANFPPGTRFTGAIRSYVDNWNKAVKAAEHAAKEGKLAQFFKREP